MASLSSIHVQFTGGVTADRRARLFADLRVQIGTLIANAGSLVGTSPLLVHRIVAAFDSAEKLRAFDPAELSDDVAGDVRALYGSVRDVNAALLELQALVPADAPPVTPADVLAALMEYERVTAAVGTAAKAWGDEALKGPALKAECITRMVADGMSRNVAEKSVTADAVYSAHKERLDELVRGKYDAETAADVAKTRLVTLRDIMNATRPFLVDPVPPATFGIMNVEDARRRGMIVTEQRPHAIESYPHTPSGRVLTDPNA